MRLSVRRITEVKHEAGLLQVVADICVEDIGLVLRGVRTFIDDRPEHCVVMLPGEVPLPGSEDGPLGFDTVFDRWSFMSLAGKAITEHRLRQMAEQEALGR
jgi:hypothetical protein